MSHENAPSLPAAECPTCQREVVVEWTLDEADELVSLCIHCSDVLAVTHHVSLPDAVELGYVAPGFEPPHGERGCRDGACGVQQPSA